VSNFREAYDGLSELMVHSGVNGHSNEIWPIWAWRKWDGKVSRPDRRRMMFNNEHHPMLELDIPEDRLLLINGYIWDDYLINGWPVPYEHEDPDDWISRSEHLTAQDDTYSWERLIDVSNSDEIQACFWSIRNEDIISVR
jgi:hypothetical protein